MIESNSNTKNLNIMLSKTTLDELNIFVRELDIDRNQFIRLLAKLNERAYFILHIIFHSESF